MASVNWYATIPVKGVFKVNLNAGGVTQITCTKRGIYKLVAVGGAGGGTSMASEHNPGSSVVKPGVGSSGGAAGMTIVYRVLNVGDIIYYVGGGNAEHTRYVNGDNYEGAGGWNGGLNGKNFGSVNRGASGGMSYFMIHNAMTLNELKSAHSLANVLGIAGGGGGGKGGLGRDNGSSSDYVTANGGSGGGSPCGTGRYWGDRDEYFYQDPQYASNFSWDTFGEGEASTWGGCGGAGYVGGSSSNNYGGNGGVGWVNPSFASVTHKNKVWTGSTQTNANLSAGIYWEKTWISPLIYYGDREVDSVYYGNKEIDTIYYGSKELG